jgi:hypothetical protein
MSNIMTGREVLRAIADGAEIEDFEYGGQPNWHRLNDEQTVQWLRVTQSSFRRKPRTRVINGFTVSAPETTAPPMGSTYYVPDVYEHEWNSDFLWDGEGLDLLWLERGLVFLTEEAPVANAKAMCGIDPDKKD